MYGPLWRRLPGPWPVRWLVAALLLLAAVAVCFLWVFPVVAAHLPFNDNTVAGQTGSHASPTPAHSSSSTPQ